MTLASKWGPAILLLAFTGYGATPSITWSESSVDRTMCPGFRLTETVSFTSSDPLANAYVEVVPELQPYVAVTPTSFARISPGNRYNVQITISVPTDSVAGVMREGTIHLRTGSATIPALLHIVLEIKPACVQSPSPDALFQDPSGAIFPLNELIVMFKPGVSKTEVEQLALGFQGLVIGLIPSANAYQLRLPSRTMTELNAFITQLQADSRVAKVLPNVSIHLSGISTDLQNLKACHGDDVVWSYDRIRIQVALDLIDLLRPPLEPLFVAALEFGLEARHQEFAGVDISGSNNAANEHGTAISGIIGANNRLTANDCSSPNGDQMTGALGGVSGLPYNMRTTYGGSWSRNFFLPPWKPWTGKLWGFAAQIAAQLEILAQSHTLRTANLSFDVSG